jgi:uncharacterized membrane protein
LWFHQVVGSTPIFNWLLVGFGGIAFILVRLAAEQAKNQRSRLALVLRVFALLLTFLFVHSGVRQWFHGNYLDNVSVSILENYCYSAAWILLACGLLAAAILTGNVLLRYASLAIISLAMMKVFLYDSAHLRDLYRVLAFFGLGISLLGIAYVYQRVIFRRVRENST